MYMFFVYIRIMIKSFGDKGNNGDYYNVEIVDYH